MHVAANGDLAVFLWKGGPIMDLSTEKQGLSFDNNNNIVDWLSKRQNTIAFLWRKTSSASHPLLPQSSCALSGWMFQQRARNLADKHLPECFSSCLAAITNHVRWVQWLSKLDAGRHGPSIYLPTSNLIYFVGSLCALLMILSWHLHRVQLSLFLSKSAKNKH